MEISINNKPADIVVENEKTIGELLAGLEQWLEGSGSRLSGLCIDGIETDASGINDVFERRLDSIKTLDIRISLIDELAMEALQDLREYCNVFAHSSFDEKAALRQKWEQSAASAFLSSEIKDMHELSSICFSGHGITSEHLGILAEERIRELASPAEEILNIETPLMEIIHRMEELPLDMQTGKDSRAGETIQLFSGMGEKVFRIMHILKKRGLDFDSFMISDLNVSQFLDDFGGILKELTSAYTKQDIVMIGDLAEYELAPRLTNLFKALKQFSLTGAVK